MLSQCHIFLRFLVGVFQTVCLFLVADENHQDNDNRSEQHGEEGSDDGGYHTGYDHSVASTISRGTRGAGAEGGGGWALSSVGSDGGHGGGGGDIGRTLAYKEMQVIIMQL